MSAESLKAFTEKVAAGTDLTKRAKSISPNDFPAIIAFAKELGHAVTEQDLTRNNEIANDVLDTIAGGVGGGISPNAGYTAITAGCYLPDAQAGKGGW